MDIESSDEDYFTAEEEDMEHIPLPPIPGFVVWTSPDGTVWYLPRCETI